MKQLILFICLTAGTLLYAQTPTAVQEAMSNYDYERALMLIEEETPSAQLIFQKALALKGLSRHAEALGLFRKVAEENPENQRATIELAECYKSLGKFNDALKTYTKVLEQNPDNKYIQLQKISLLYSLERFRECEDACLDMLEKEETTPVLRFLAQTYEGMMELELAVEVYQRAIKKMPNDYFSVVKLATLYMDMHIPELAVDITEEYRKTDKDNLYVNRKNAQALCLCKEYPLAIERYTKLVQQGDSTFATSYYLGMSYFAEQEFYNAHDFLNIAYRYKPDDVNVLFYLGRSCARTSWKERGVELLEKAIDNTIPNDSTVAKLYNGLVECTRYAGNYRKYIAACKQQYKYSPGNHMMLYNISHAYAFILNDLKNAERYLEMFLKTKPKGEEGEKDDYPEIDEKGNLVVKPKNYYKIAEKWLADIKKDKFFKEGVQKRE